MRISIKVKRKRKKKSELVIRREQSRAVFVTLGLADPLVKAVRKPAKWEKNLGISPSSGQMQ